MSYPNRRRDNPRGGLRLDVFVDEDGADLGDRAAQDPGRAHYQPPVSDGQAGAEPRAGRGALDHVQEFVVGSPA